MLLRDEIDIVCRPEDVFSWLERFEDFYTLWHHDHITCSRIRGESLQPGAVFYCQEHLHGRPHKLRMTVKRVDPGSRVEYSVGPLISGSFAVRPAGQGVRFIAELRLGSDSPVIATVQDAVIGRVLRGKVAILRRHMREESLGLKTMIESGIVSGQRELRPSVIPSREPLAVV